eukprot:SAG11_NODE_16431_length_547_cov_1.709821_2_plen_62_part_01
MCWEHLLQPLKGACCCRSIHTPASVISVPEYGPDWAYYSIVTLISIFNVVAAIVTAIWAENV